MDEAAKPGLIGSPYPVLIVEDNGLNQKVAVLLLQRLGMAADIAANGLEAVDAIARKKYCLILMDCHMPEMDGFEATSAIRAYQASRGAYTPIIAVTALTSDNDRQRCLEVGMDDYIAKPIEKDSLEEKIDHWLKVARNIEYKIKQNATTTKNKLAVMPVRDGTTGGDWLNFEELEDFYGRDQLSNMLQQFMADTMENILLLEGSVRDHNGRQVSAVAAKIKGACDTIGAKQLSKLLHHQQEAALKEDWIEASQALLSIQRSFAHNKNLFQCGIITEENAPVD